MNVYTRKDKKESCFVCYKPLHDLRDLNAMKGTSEEGTDRFHTLVHRVTETIVRIPGRRSLLRHIHCEPGGSRYLKRAVLRKSFKSHFKS